MNNVLLWLLLALIWSSSYGAIKIGLEGYHPMVLVAGRMIVGALLMLIMLRFRGFSLSSRPGDWLTYLISGMTGNIIPFFLISFGENHVSSALAAMLMGIAPVATVMVAPLVLADERYSRMSSFGIAIGMIGLVLLIGPDALEGIGDHVIGQFAILAAALCYAFTTIYVRRFAKGQPMEMAAGSMLVGAIIVNLAVFLLGLPVLEPTPGQNATLALIYLGVFPTALATLIYFHLVPRIGASSMSQINFAVPVGGALIGVFVLGESISVTSVIGLVVIMVAIYLVTSKKAKERAAGVSG